MSTVPRRRFLAQLAGAGVITPALTFPETVSYTHLTLPTKA